MIVRTLPDAVQLITQPDHARLARRIMERSVALAGSPRRESILLAVGEHDNGWVEEDAAPTREPETGAVADFIEVPARVRRGVWARALARLAGDPWAAALVAQHAITVYDRFRVDPEWKGFFAETEAARDGLLAPTGLPLDQLVADYTHVRLGDLISLTFCTGWSDVQRFREWTVELAGPAGRVVVRPDLFGGEVLAIEVESRELSRTTFRSDAELRDALSRALVVPLQGEVAGRD